MFEKVYITSNQMANFVCPKCGRSKRVDVSQYANLGRLVKVRVKCPCGYAYTSLLEKRKKYRRATNLEGSYIRIIDGKEMSRGLMTVTDLSATGMKLHINGRHEFEVGDPLKVEFHLDDTQRSHIRKLVIIRNIDRSKIGAELAPTEAVDKALGFYLFR